jgi:hypothetical protein
MPENSCGNSDRMAEDDLYALNLQLGEGSYPKQQPATRRLAAPERGWLRKHYAPAPIYSLLTTEFFGGEGDQLG